MNTDMSKVPLTNDLDETTEFLPLKMTDYTAKMKQKAREELNETEEKVQQCLPVLRSFIQKEKLPLPQDDIFLLIFLRGKKFRLQDVQDSLKSYEPIQGSALKYHISGDFSRVRKVIEHQICGLLPYRDQEGRVIIFFRASKWDPQICTAEDVIVCAKALTYHAFHYPPTTICGLRCIIDASVSSKAQLWFHVNNFKLMLSMLTGFPARLQQIDIFNENAIVRLIINAIRHIFSKKIFGRIQTHGTNLESLVQNFHPSILPQEFGGTLGPLSWNSYVDDLEDCIEEFKAVLQPLYGNDILK